MTAPTDPTLTPDARAALVLSGAAGDLLALGRLDLARDLAVQALRIDATPANCHSVMAGIQEEDCAWDAAMEHWRDAAHRAPDNASHRFNLALALMLRGEWREALPLQEARLEMADWMSLAAKGSLDGIRFRLFRPGDALAGKSVLAFSEQGLGDNVWAMRWLLPLAARGVKLELASRAALAPLVRLIAPGLPLMSPPDGKDEVKMNMAALAGRFETFLPMMSLPLAMGVEAPGAEAGGASMPYLRPDPSAIARWRARYAAALPGAQRVVGVVWRANPESGSAPRRNLPPPALAPLAGVPGLGFVNLQGGAPEGRDAMAAALPGMLDAMADGEKPLDDFAAAIAATDLLVTVDTLAAHMGGAMGHDTAVLLAAQPGFYYGLGRADCPWYPSLSLHRQAVPGDWASAVASLLARLR